MDQTTRKTTGPAVTREALQAVLERFMAMEHRNRDLKKRFEALPAEMRLEGLRHKLTRVKSWLDDQKTALDAEVRKKNTAAELNTEAGAVSRFSPKARIAMAALALAGVIAGFMFLGGPAGFKAAAARFTASPPASPLTPIVLEKREAPGLPASPAAHQVGLAYHNGRWLSVDWAESRIFEFKPGSGLTFLRNFPNSFTTGLSAGAGSLWSIDAFNRRCYRHDPESFAIRASFTTPGPSPSAVHWDGDSLWLADKQTRRAYKYLNIRGSAITLVQYQLLEKEPVGLWRTDKLLWVLDRAAKTVRRYRVEGDKGLVPEDTLQLSGWLPDKTRPAGMALTGPEVWILTESPCMIYRFALSRIDWKSDGGGKP